MTHFQLTVTFDCTTHLNTCGNVIFSLEEEEEGKTEEQSVTEEMEISTRSKGKNKVCKVFRW